MDPKGWFAKQKSKWKSSNNFSAKLERLVGGKFYPTQQIIGALEF
jgi:hypothetical protein